MSDVRSNFSNISFMPNVLAIEPRKKINIGMGFTQLNVSQYQLKMIPRTVVNVLIVNK